MQRNRLIAMALLIASTVTVNSGLPASAVPKESCNSAKETASAATKTGSRTHSVLPLKLNSGIASWYGHPFHGKKTASGQIFDMNKLTAAHLTLPMSSRVMVRNPQNGKIVILTINDRGPYIKDRVIDLSREAAKQLGMLSSGIGFVDYAIVPPDTRPETIASILIDED